MGKERDGTGPERPTTSLSPSAEFPPLSAQDVEALRRLGEHWRAGEPVRALPVDPELRPSGPGAAHARGPNEEFRPDQPGELTTTPAAEQPDSLLGRLAVRVRRVLLGPPLSSTSMLRERMRKLIALPILSSDLLSSVAYGPEALLTILVLAGSAALGLSLPIAGALVVLMVAVGASYRQTVRAYPHGAGSYLVASDSIGPRAGLTAAAGLILDYVLTVSVSVAAGIAAITSALPALSPLAVPLSLLVIAALLTGNLRGIRVAGNIFAAPTYLFLIAIGGMTLVGLAQAGARGFAVVPAPPVPASEAVSVLLIARAFASGATSMTGIEAVSNAVPALRPTEWRNARTVLTWMVSILVLLFSGLMFLIYLNGLVPRANETLLSQLAHRTFPHGPWYAIVQAATALVLLLAANTAYNDLPRLLYFMARDAYVPRRFLHLGDRLALSNGLVALSVAAAVILTAFGGRTQSLIPLFAVGVFLAFTLSQVGMVNHWRRHRESGWRRRAGINAFGAALSSIVLVTAAITKFTSGAWVVVVAVPVLVLLCLRVRRHYDRVRQAVSLRPAPAPTQLPSEGGRERNMAQEFLPQRVRHLLVVPVARFDQTTLRALAYVVSLGQPSLAVHVSPEDQEADRLRDEWTAWGDHIRLETVVSPHREILEPLAQYIAQLRERSPDITLTVVIPEVVAEHPWQRILHSRIEHRLRKALRRLPGVVITSMPIHLSEVHSPAR
ncbi:APC family permease [Micromonospora narathiwatensis]|uniref:Amino acid/polyamine/organocation transporter, APC superfamily n=1 Tax=Micromonospora narathiwatensis TaxID=299146 RepID=A0A1A8ZZH9_9ACTN|nr:APC family permease [Micromonospora narathiwatensis]SBT49296.1 amino acid/polyamine/organocation transporter, APC superfamily [Micromonospora narathiwatensis]